MASPPILPAPQSITQITFLVREYAEAISFFTQKLGFTLLEDADLGAGKRWVVVRPANTSGANLLLARAATPEQAAAIGNQAGGRVFLFLHTDNFERDHAAMIARGVRFLELPRMEPYGTVAVFEDLYGNKWDLLEPIPGRRSGRL
jgi:catechol 2,3-dioxygenase-like lactoylglutathione lyase family enzyme